MDVVHEHALQSTVLSNLQDHLQNLGGTSSGSEKWSKLFSKLDAYTKGVHSAFLEHMVTSHDASKWPESLDVLVRITLKQKRFSQFFDMVAQFPKSQDAVSDIKECLKLGHSLETELMEEFSRQIHQRLLQAGAATRDIIQHFLNAANLLSQIDATGRVF